MPVWAVIRYALAAALLASLALSGVLVWVMQRNAALSVENHDLRVSLVSARQALSQAAEAAAVHRVYLDQQEAEARRWQQLANVLQSMEGRDAPLSVLLSATAERLYARP